MAKRNEFLSIESILSKLSLDDQENIRNVLYGKPTRLGNELQSLITNKTIKIIES